MSDNKSKTPPARVRKASVGTGSTRLAYPEQAPFAPQTEKKPPAASVGLGQAKRVLVS